MNSNQLAVAEASFRQRSVADRAAGHGGEPAQLGRQWRMLVQNGATAAEQMAIDVALAEQAQPAFRLFRWSRPACSLGFRQPAPVWIDRSEFERAGIELIERPTGGGLAVHGSDLSCSVVMPRQEGVGPSALLEALGNTVVRAAARFGVSANWIQDVPAVSRIAHCLTEHSPYAVMVGRRKVCGFALRRLPDSWLAQGSLLVRELPAAFDRVMPSAVRDAFRTQAVSLHEAAGAAVRDEQVIEAMQTAWSSMWGSDAV